MSMQGPWQDRAYFLLLLSKGRSGSNEEKFQQRRRNVEVLGVRNMWSSRRSGRAVGVCVRVSTSTQNLGPLYPVKSCTTRFALSIPLRHTEGHLAFMLPLRVKDEERSRGMSEG